MCKTDGHYQKGGPMSPEERQQIDAQLMAEAREQLYTARAVCFATGIVHSTLNYYASQGLLKKLSAPRRPGKWRRYTFEDTITLAVMQRLIDLGIEQRDSMNWALLVRDQVRARNHGDLTIHLGKDQFGNDAQDVLSDDDAPAVVVTPEVTLTLRVENIIGRIASRLFGPESKKEHDGDAEEDAVGA
jgi:hypothetical protein